MKSENAAQKGAEAVNTVKQKAGEAASAAKDAGKEAKKEAQAWGSRFEDTGRRAADGAQQVVGSVHDARNELNAVLQEQAESRPYMALGAAAALGFVLAGGLTIRMSSKLMAIGGRLLVGAAVKRVFG